MRSAPFILPFVASAAAAAVNTGNPTAVEGGLPLPLGEIGWEGVVTPGGPSVKVWGASFEDIEAKIREDYPEFSIYEEEEQTGPETSPVPEVVTRAALEKRQRYCDPRFGRVMPHYIDQCISALRRINGNNCWARARHCIRNQCINGGAVGMCNDNHHDINIPCTRVADMAANIRQNCWEVDTACKAGQGCWGENHTTFGQLFDAGGFNVIVGQCGFFGNGQRPVKA
ncbi:hypothetical protein B0T11DRAFT_359937 [Plectosphaerella cucumerina]|uniref:Uncharacterized protein n=1 Tax=Plectosphaerella cucumerina TaxID=40658 RepID=A0A8K0T7C2_9PEZI|nr:hypothetical protein B0T11DRAFT_359937 [Plectosphaerella cucumerina]